MTSLLYTLNDVIPDSRWGILDDKKWFSFFIVTVDKMSLCLVGTYLRNHWKHLLFRYMTLYIEKEYDIKKWENGTQKTKKQKTNKKQLWITD
jgi:hypothetical protein